MTEIKLIREDDKATKILAAVAQIDAGVELAPNYRQAIKQKADSTLLGMKKEELIEYIRMLERNYNAAVWFNENQAKNIEHLLNTFAVVRCKDCKHMTIEPCGRYCLVWGNYNGMGDDGFCNYGERRINDGKI